MSKEAKFSRRVLWAEFFSAALLCAIAILLSELSFDPLYGFGPHEAGHLVGYAGLVIGMICFIQPAVTVQAHRRWTQLIAASVATFAAIWLGNFCGKIPADIARLLSVVLVISLGASIFFGNLLHGVARRWPLLCAAASCLMFSGYWELFLQPFVAVYDSGRRGWIQWPQVVSDAIGICIGLIIAKRNRKVTNSAAFVRSGQKGFDGDAVDDASAGHRR
jgi:hypothetical protein